MTPAKPRLTARNTKLKKKFSNNVPPGLHFLPPLDPKSEEFAELFRSLLSSKDGRKDILALSEGDAKVFIEIVDRAFGAGRLEAEPRQLALGVLRKLCGKVGNLPESYLLSDTLELSGPPRAYGGFADVRIGVFRGKSVAAKSLRVAERDDKARIRKRFCKEVATWKNLSHPNVLDLFGVPDTLEDGRFCMVSEWMANGNIMEYIRNHAGNYLKLLTDAAEGLKYLHSVNIVHGDLKGANILITNANPVTACLADFGFMTIVHDPSLEMESSKSEAGGGTTPFMAPELLVPSKFGLDKCTPSKEADVYAMGMAVYQVLTGTLPFGKLSGPEVLFKVLADGRPSKPSNALELGLSDNVWRLLEDCWKTQRKLRPLINDVFGRVKAAASVCGVLSPVGGITQRYEDPESELDKFDQLFLGTVDDEGIVAHRKDIPESNYSSPLANLLPAMDHSPSQGPTPTDAPARDLLLSPLSDAESSITEPASSTSQFTVAHSDDDKTILNIRVGDQTRDAPQDDDANTEGIKSQSFPPSVVHTSSRLPQRHDKYYFDDGSVILLVDGTLFRVHTYYFTRESKTFERMFSPVRGASGSLGATEGKSDRSPIEIPGVTKQEMENFLEFVCFGMYGEHTSTQESWTSLLSFSTHFACDKLRERSIRELEAIQPRLDPVERIVLAVRHNIPHWRSGAYQELCQRRDPLLEVEGERLGVSMVVKLMRAREIRLSAGLATVTAADPGLTQQRRFSSNVPPWLHHLPLDPESEELTEWFRLLLSSKHGLTNILALSGKDAKLFIEIVDRAFQATSLETELGKLALNVLKRLCGKIGHLPESYLLSDKFDLSGPPCAYGGFANVRKGVFRGKNVAVKSLRVAEMDDKDKIRRHFCREVAMWKNLFHPNVLDLVGVPDTLEDGTFSMVSEWMVNGNIMEYVRNNAGNHLKLLAGAAEGLRYLHSVNIVHGDLKGANILITNANPVTACLADFGFMTIVHDPSLGMESSKSEVSGGTTPFMAPELLVPRKFGLDRCTPSKEADAYAIGMTIYQVLTGTPPFGNLTRNEVVFAVLRGERPLKPANALELGLSDRVWGLLRDCWNTQRTLRPSINDVLDRVKTAASACRTLPSVRDISQQYEESKSDSDRFIGLFLGGTDDEGIGAYRKSIPVPRIPLRVDHSPSRGSTLTDASASDSGYSELSEAESPIAKPAQTNTDALPRFNYLKGRSTETFSDISLLPASDPAHEAHSQTITDPIPRSSTPGSEVTLWPQSLHGDSGPYWNKGFAESSESCRTLLSGVAPLERDRPDTASTFEPHEEATRAAEKLPAGNPLDFSFLLVSDATGVGSAQTKDGPTYQLRKPTSTSSLRSSTSRSVSPRLDDHAKRKTRRVSDIRDRLGRAFTTTGNINK